MFISTISSANRHPPPSPSSPLFPFNKRTKPMTHPSRRSTSRSPRRFTSSSRPSDPLLPSQCLLIHSSFHASSLPALLFLLYRFFSDLIPGRCADRLLRLCGLCSVRLCVCACCVVQPASPINARARVGRETSDRFSNGFLSARGTAFLSNPPPLL
jgi:hypothetical protein